MFPHIHNDELALYDKSQEYYLGGIGTHDPCNSRAVSYHIALWSYQIDPRDCPAARRQFDSYVLAVGTANNLLGLLLAAQ